METAEAWRPLLTEDLAEEARKAVLEIAAALERPGEGPADPTVASGSAGLALFHTYLALALADDRWADAAAAWFDHMVEAVASAPLGHGLYSGLLGIGWTIEHLKGRLYAAEDEEEAADDGNAEIDETMLRVLRQKTWPGDYDLIRGLAGIGVYALERLPRPSARQCLFLVLIHLVDSAEQTAAGRTWHTASTLLPPSQREQYPLGYYNLGVAHGTPGVIALLGAVAAAGLLDPGVRPTLDGAVSWLLAQELPADSVARFPHFAGEGIAPAPSRLAWCYGDLGIAVALLGAARQAGNADWEREARRIARAAAARKPETTDVADAGLCHGAAGVGHLFNRLYQATGDEDLAAAARFWFERALDLRHPGEGIAGFLAMVPEPGGAMSWQRDPGFLTGAAGIGLALLAAVSPVEPEWDRLLLASNPCHRIPE